MSRGYDNQDFLFDTAQSAQAALDAANQKWNVDEEGSAHPEGRIAPASEKDGTFELGGDQFAALDDSGEWMVSRNGEWVEVA